MNDQTFHRFGLRPAFGALLLMLVACSGGESPATCYTTPDCPSGNECSGGKCVRFVACGAGIPCSDGGICEGGICRKPCVSDPMCAADGLLCNETNQRCAPMPNPIAPAAGANAGGSAGASNVAGAAGSVGGTPGQSGGGTASIAGAAGSVTSGGSAPIAGSNPNPGVAGSNAAGTGSGGMMSVAGSGAGGSSGGSNGNSAGKSSAGAGAAGANQQPGRCETTWDGYSSYNGNGSVTFYTFDMGSNCPSSSPNPPSNKCVNCGFKVSTANPDVVSHVYTGNGQYFAAMNTEDFRSAAACGACVEVTRDGNRKVVATVVDQCPVASNPKCKRGHIDLSREAFRQIGQDSEGYLGTGNGGMHGSISWKFVPCPVPASQNVSVRLKEPNNQYYTAVIAQDHVFPIQSVRIKGQNAARDGASNYWMVGDGNQNPPPWNVSVTDVNGWVYEATLNLGSADVSTGRRATCN